MPSTILCCGFKHVAFVEKFATKLQFAILAENMSPSDLKTKLKTVKAPLLRDAHKNINGILIYQEQLFKILQVIGGISIQEVYLCRKKLAESKRDINTFQDHFIKYVMKKFNISPKYTQQFWNKIEQSSTYIITKSIPVPEGQMIYKIVGTGNIRGNR